MVSQGLKVEVAGETIAVRCGNVVTANYPDGCIQVVHSMFNLGEWAHPYLCSSPWAQEVASLRKMLSCGSRHKRDRELFQEFGIDPDSPDAYQFLKRQLGVW